MKHSKSLLATFDDRFVAGKIVLTEKENIIGWRFDIGIEFHILAGLLTNKVVVRVCFFYLASLQNRALVTS